MMDVEAEELLVEDVVEMSQPRHRLRRALVGSVFSALAVVAVISVGRAASSNHVLVASSPRVVQKVAVRPKGGMKSKIHRNETALACAKAKSEDCSTSQCCKDPGFQCYAKDHDWAVCLEDCDAEAMQKYDPERKEWSCKELGERHPPCSRAETDDCSKSQCCQEVGYQCYSKHDDWAVCLQECDGKEMQKYDPEKKEWSCKELGERRAPCAKSETDDCSHVQCCQEEGYQCYAKDDDWGVCKKECDAEEMKKFDPDGHDWTCEELGKRKRCAEPNEDCRAHGCCVTPGSVCYEKNEDWSMCMPSCDSAEMKKNDPDGGEWSCKEIGQRNFKSQCSWAGQDCSDSKCCNNRGFTCVTKDDIFSGCTLTEKISTWFTRKVPIPDGWEGTVLGGSRDEFEVAPAPEGQDPAGADLFCVMVYLPDSDEETLMWLAKKNGVSIFGCDGHATYHSWQSQGGEWDTGEVTLMNTAVFINVFEQVRTDGDYLKHDWLIKVDPDCVFFADRMRQHIWELRPPAYTPIYLKNNDMDAGLGNNGFLGAVEVFSTTAMQTFFANMEDCHQFLGEDSGEDGFFKGCMDALGVGFMLDANIFAPDYDPAVCREGGRVAFHPIKKDVEWQCCVDIVMGKKRHVEYGKCKDNGELVERDWMQE